MGEQEEALDDRAALLEMYKAGFLDGYKKGNSLKKKDDWDKMNKEYMKSFLKRFNKSVKIARER